MGLFCYLIFLLSVLSLTSARPHTPNHDHHRGAARLDTCANPALLPDFDYSAKTRGAIEAPGLCLAPPIFRRATSATNDDDDYSCNEHKPCKNGACCSKKTGYCNYGVEACGTNGTSPNDVCWSNCDAHAECGKNALPAGKQCPLGVCCSEYGFCGTTKDFCTKPACQSGCDQPHPKVKPSNVQNRIIGYYEAWNHDSKCQNMNFRDIPVESLTHMNFAFGFITPDTFDITPMPGVDPQALSDFTALKSRNSDIKATISIGGWSFNDNGTATQTVFSQIVSDHDKRTQFISNLLAFLRQYGFDGVDFDWEYPGAPDRGGRPDDGVNFTALLKELKAAIADRPESYEVSFTAPTSYWYLQYFDLKNMMKEVDYLNLMTYDLHGVWDADNPIGNTVLAHTNLTEIKEALNLLWRSDLDPQQINLGLGFYGRSFELSSHDCTTPGCPFKGGAAPGPCSKNSGTLTYSEITAILADSDIQPVHDEENAVKYFTWNQNQWVSYDDQDTYQQKIAYANSQGLGGLMLWAIDQDTVNLDALRGVLHPKPLRTLIKAPDTSYWDSISSGDCYAPTCGTTCKPGTITVNKSKCEKGDQSQSICCPISAAPDPAQCQWRGGETGPLCNGHCHGGEVALASSLDGDGGHHCNDGRKFFCCRTPASIEGRMNCGWKGVGNDCDADETLQTFAGTVVDGIADVASYFGLGGKALSSALDDIDSSLVNKYCCPTEQAKQWKSCYWAGTPNKGFLGGSSCDDNHCATGHEVQLTDSPYGEGENCLPTSRARVYCCSPSNDQSPFLPVPLDDLFPSPPPGDPILAFNLEEDDTWGTGIDREPDDEDPNNSAFGFYIITSPEEKQISLDKRDGSHWEVFDCLDSQSEDEQTVRMICTDVSESSNCHKIHLGHGVPGTILEMPKGCGPGKYAVAKTMEVSNNQLLPDHLKKRDLSGQTVYDLVFDYNFRRVPRDFGPTMMRIDYSNEEGYWDTVVNKTGDTKQKRSLEEMGRNHKRWLEEEWRDDVHHGALSTREIHKRWFGSDVIDWIKTIIDVGKAVTDPNKSHEVDETLSIILVDDQWSCPISNTKAMAQASIKATINTSLKMSTSYGLTIITTLDFPPDLSNSYLYFKNRGSITSKFELEAVASVSYESGDIKMIGLDDFPGATFRIPGIVTVGPNIAVYGSVDASLVVAGHLEAEVTLAQWETEQTYPQQAAFPADAVDQPDRDGTQTLGTPTFDWSVSATGEVALHLKPQITFGIVFDPRWKVDRCAVDLVADGYLIFHADARYGSGDNSCPFTYGIDAGADMYVQLTAPTLFGWGGQNRIPLASMPRKQITPGGTCPSKEKREISWKPEHFQDPETGYISNRSSYTYTEDEVGSLPSLDPILDTAIGASSVALALSKRDVHAVGPLIRIPQQFLGCPSNGPEEALPCPECGQVEDATDESGITRREDDSCPLFPPPGEEPDDSYCTTSGIFPRRTLAKMMKFSWKRNVKFSTYNPCSTNDLKSTSAVSRFWAPTGLQKKECTPDIKQFDLDQGGSTVGQVPVSQFANDHVFEAHLVKDFLEWLCGGLPMRYTISRTTIQYPQGWAAADTTWCDAVLGTDAGNTFQYTWKGQKRTFFQHAGAALGNAQPDGQKRMAILYAKTNGLKKIFTEGHLPRDKPVGKWTIAEAQVRIRDAASVFSYLRDQDIKPKWVAPAQDLESIADAFDKQYNWAQTQGSSMRALSMPAKPSNVASWGLRTMWAYWIDNHLARCELTVAVYLKQSQSRLEAKADGSSPSVDRFIKQYMNGQGLATVGKMTFPRDVAFAQLALPGSGQSAGTMKSKYMMWGSNGLGPLGI